MSNKPSAKAIARLNATTLFPEIKKEIVANPSLFAIRGFFIFNITKKAVPMTEWYILLQGFDQAPIVSQKRPEIPKVKQDEQPIPVAIFQIEDSDLLNFMSGGLTGPRGIVSGKIKIAGAIELAEQLEEIFRKAKGAEKTLAYLEHKRGKSEKTKARLATPAPTQSKVQSLARRYSAMAKQAATESSAAHQDKPKPVVIGKISNIFDKNKASASVAAAAATATVAAVKTPEIVKEQEEPFEEEAHVDEKVETTVQDPISEVSDITDKVQEIDLTQTPVKKEEEQEFEISEEPEEVVIPEVKDKEKIVVPEVKEEETIVVPEEEEKEDEGTVVVPEEKKEESAKVEDEHKEETAQAVVEEESEVEEASVTQEQPQEQEEKQPEVTKVTEIETPVESVVEETKLVEA
ncbi:hypothetical protein BGZ93_006273 [Podila epicladia]|nr:hypothetical protein BGZ93_006273 [Podila epicladia]